MLVVTIALLLASVGLKVLTPYIFNLFISGLEGLSTASPLLIIPLYGVAYFLFRGFDDFRLSLYGVLEQAAQRRLASRVVGHVLRLPYLSRSERDIGSLSITIDRGLEGARNVLHSSLFLVFPLALEVILACTVILLVFGWQVSALVVGMLVVFAAVTWVLARQIQGHQRSYISLAIGAYGKMADAVLNFETIKLFSAEAFALARYDRAQEAFVAKVRKALNSLAVLGLLQAAIIGLGISVVTWQSAQSFFAGAVSLGDVVMLNAYFLQFIFPLTALSGAYNQILLGLANVAKLEDLLNEPAELERHEGSERSAAVIDEIEFKSVDFSYGTTTSALSDVSFTLKRNQTVAIVGESGSGKTTLSRLLLGLISPTSGSIIVRGENVGGLSLQDARHRIAVVPQDIGLLNDTIRQNLLLANPKASLELVHEAAAKAHIHEFIMSLEDGYDTPVGERGIRLSGGQKQRLGIARSLLRSPDLLVFDEVTASLDTITESEVMRSVVAASAHKLAVIISHNLRAIENAALIIVLDKGRVAEAGSHAELVSQKGLYWKMHREQLGDGLL